MTLQTSFQPGSLVSARGREWIVLPQSSEDTLHLRPLGATDDDATLIYLPIEPGLVGPASFPWPSAGQASNFAAGQLLRDALQLKLRTGAGPFRSFGNIAVEPRAYQLVPMLMALKQEVVRLLIADDVGIGKTIEAALIVRELQDRGEIGRLAVLCPPHLCEQWQRELKDRFHINAVVVRSTTANRLERGLPANQSVFEAYPFTVVSLDYIKSDRRRDEFQRACPECVIVDEAHTCTFSGQGKQQRYTLLKGLSENVERHMLLLTATPHSGDEEAFYNLLGLLRPEFRELKDSPSDSRKPLREQLANHFVQRRRPDIEEWQDRNVFPERLSTEITYKLSGEWGKLFDEVLDYARDLIERAEGKGMLQQRMSWWAALALLRCISSSPAAAVNALRTRLQGSAPADEDSPTDIAITLEEAEEQGRERVLDGLEDDLSTQDIEPGARTEDGVRLSELISRAEGLAGAAKDPKLKKLIDHLKELTAAGFQPVVFCRYIATAHYVAEHLRTVFRDHQVIPVTGEFAPAEREAAVEAMAEAEQRILVATDCLSEGINLQNLFTAVVHYDLSWNPTRHEQREGRVDRFGQKAREVRTTMLYGQDNPVDGAVLQVILRKAESIRKELGVLVPKRDAEAASLFAHDAGRYPLTGVGDVNTYALFAETFAQMVSCRGRAGFIVPSGIGTDDSTKRYFQFLVGERMLVSFFGFDNARRIFPAVHPDTPFALVTIGKTEDLAELGHYLLSIGHLADPRRRFTLSPMDFALINPNTLTCPVFRSERDAELTKKLYRNAPVLITEGPPEVNPWGIRFMRQLDMSNDSHLFADAPATDKLPLYEAKMIHQFDHRWASYGLDGDSTDVSVSLKEDPNFRVTPRYWIDERVVLLKISRLPKMLLDQLRADNRELVVLSMAIILFSHWLRARYGNRLTDCVNSLYPEWQDFVTTFPFARDIDPTQTGLGGDNPTSFHPVDKSHLPCAPIDKIVTTQSERTGWIAADPLRVESFLGWFSELDGVVDLSAPVRTKADALALAETWLIKSCPQWLMGWRDITNATNERTVIAGLIPRAGVGNKMPLFIFGDQTPPRLSAAFYANLGALAFDFVARQKIGGTTLNYFYLKQFPVLSPDRYTDSDLGFIVPRVLELTYTAHDLEPWGKSLGFNGPPFAWNPSRRAQLRAELDAYYARLYGLTRDELRYILDPADVMGDDYPSETFRVLKNNEMREFGEYRTRRLVLEAWDALHSGTC